GGAVEVGHRGRVVQHYRRVAPGDRGAGIGAAQVLDAVLADLEAGSVGLAGGQHARDAERQGGKSKTGSVLHAGDLRLYAQCCLWWYLLLSCAPTYDAVCTISGF